MKKAPHEAGPKARNNNTYKQISIGLASPQYALGKPVTQRDLALGNTHVVWWRQTAVGHRLPAQLGGIRGEGGR